MGPGWSAERLIGRGCSGVWLCSGGRGRDHSALVQFADFLDPPELPLGRFGFGQWFYSVPSRSWAAASWARTALAVSRRSNSAKITSHRPGGTQGSPTPVRPSGMGPGQVGGAGEESNRSTFQGAHQARRAARSPPFGHRDGTWSYEGRNSRARPSPGSWAKTCRSGPAISYSTSSGRGDRRRGTVRLRRTSATGELVGLDRAS